MACHLPSCRCEDCERTQRDLDEFALAPVVEIKRVTVGEITAVLLSTGTIYLEGPMLMTRPLVGLTKSTVQDLLVALDGVTNEMPDAR